MFIATIVIKKFAKINKILILTCTRVQLFSKTTGIFVLLFSFFSCTKGRVGNLLIEKMSEWAIRSKNERFVHFWWATWASCSFLVSNMSNTLTLLIFGEWPEQFAHIAWMNESLSFLKNLQENVRKTFKKIQF